MEKTVRDPGAPKRNMSAYLLYQKIMREQFRALNPGMTFGRFDKYASAMYAEMPPAEKEAWVARTEADKQRYLNELASYVPPPGYDAKGDALVADSGARYDTDIATYVPPKDPSVPKRASGSYMFFTKEMRPKVLREFPGMEFTEVGQNLGERWRNLTPHEKKKYEDMAAEDKLRFQRETQQYTATQANRDHRPRKLNKRGSKDPSILKRLSGSYAIFKKEMRLQVMRKIPGMDSIEVGWILGERWKRLTPHEKKRYKDMAAEEKLRFQMETQHYTVTQAHRGTQRGAATVASAHEMALARGMAAALAAAVDSTPSP